MRLRLIIALVAAALGLGLGFAARAADSRGLDALAGLWWIIALVAALSLLPFWQRVLPRVESMPGLFRPVRVGQRWCTACGSPTAREGPCEVCGAAGRQKTRRLWQRPGSGASTKAKTGSKPATGKGKAPVGSRRRAAKPPRS